MSKARERYEYCKITGEPDFTAYMNYIVELEGKELLWKVEKFGVSERIKQLEAEKSELIECLKESYKRFKQYEMDVDCDRPLHHIKFINQIESILQKHKE